MIKINVSHGSSQHDVHLPSQSTFGDVKKLLLSKTGLEPERQRLFFRGKEKLDEEHLHMEGVKDKSKILLLDGAASKERKHEEIISNNVMSKASEAISGVREENRHNNEMSKASETTVGVRAEIRNNNEMSKASEAIAGVRAEVDELSQRVVALKMAVDGVTEVSEQEFVVLTELLMRQLLKLDGIEAEGEARLQRKAEVCRVQSYVDALDSLKARNANKSNPFGSVGGIGTGSAVSVTTEWETFDSDVGTVNAAATSLSSSTKVTQDWEQFD